jgi:hypothetical protein
MHLTRRDGIATLFVAGAVALYAVWLTGTAAQNMSTRALGAVVFGLGWAACISNTSEMAVVYGVGPHRRPPIAYVVIASLIGAAALAVGVFTLTGGNEATLASLVAAIVTLWAMSTVRHAVTGEGRRNDRAFVEHLDKAA